MDDRLRQWILELAPQRLAEEKSPFQDAATSIDLEEVTVEVCDELTRQLAHVDLSERSEEIAQRETIACPDCGRMCAVEQDDDPLI